MEREPVAGVALVALPSDDGVCAIQIRRDYANPRHLHCASARALKPGDRLRYGYSYRVAAMLTQNHHVATSWSSI